MKRRIGLAMMLIFCGTALALSRECPGAPESGARRERAQPVVPDEAPVVPDEAPVVPAQSQQRLAAPDETQGVRSRTTQHSRSGVGVARRYTAAAVPAGMATQTSQSDRDSTHAVQVASGERPVANVARAISTQGLREPPLPLNALTVVDTSREAVIVQGRPRTYQVVTVPVPESLIGLASVGYVVEEAAGFNVIGRRAGTLDTREHRSALVTIGLPADAHAGRAPGAMVVFTASDKGIAVPIIIEVTAVHRIVLGSRTRIDDLEPGERFDLTFTVTNLGNTNDTVDAEVTGPDDWRISRSAFANVVIAAGETRGFSATVEVPNRSGTGGFFFRVRAIGVDTTSIQERTVTLTVGERIADNAPAGPVLRTGIGTVSVDGASPQSVAHMSVAGPVSADVAIDARIATTPRLASNAVRGLNRVGSYIGDPRLSLWSPTWRFDAGSSVTRFTDLTGVNAGATGVSFAYDGAQHEAGLLLGRPISALNSSAGHLVGVRGGSNFGPARMSASFTSLDARAATRQKLTAAGVGGEVNAFGIGTLGTELAWREYDGGSGMGWRVSFLQQNNEGHVNARIVHAPGGSSAFAHAVDEITFSADRSFGRFHLSGSLLSASDNNTAFDDMESNAWSITPQYRIGDNTSVRLSARGSAYDVQGATAFGNREAGAIAGITSQLGKLFYSVESGIERFTRTITLDGEEYESSSPRYSLRGGASYVMPYGVLQMETSYDKTRDETVSPEQLLILFRAERMRFNFMPSAMHLNAEVSHQRWAGERSFVSTRLGATYSVPLGFDVSASIERNPLASGISRSTPIVFAVRVDHRISLPRLPYGAYRGRVFQDLNGNGAWDSDEPGASQVTVRRNGVRAVTNREGEYTFWDSREDAPIVVDAATLPYGWVLADHAGSARDLPLTSISSLAVKLELGASERARNVDISGAIVIARDAAGREWIASRSGPDTAIFEALPAGTYTLDFNFASSREPLRADRTYTATVSGTTSETITVRVQGRPLRFRTSGG